eukprot:6126436-Amphidinium_carterae.1
MVADPELRETRQHNCLAAVRTIGFWHAKGMLEEDCLDDIDLDTHAPLMRRGFRVCCAWTFKPAAGLPP